MQQRKNGVSIEKLLASNQLHALLKNITPAKAPFSKLGEDGFEDVDHQILAMEIKRLAMTVKSYLEVRKNEDRDYIKAGANLNDPSIKTKTDTDSILAQTTLMMAKLHRAILRNHHQPIITTAF